MNSSELYLRRLKAIECPDSTYYPEHYPLVLAKAKGSRIWDVDGKSYLDFCSGFGALSLGHNPEVLNKVWKDLINSEQMIQGMGDVYPSLEKIKLSELVLSIAPSHLRRIAWAVTGSQAVEIALKSACLVTKKSGFISFNNAYHGLDCGVLSLEGFGKFKKPFSKLIDENKTIQLPLHCEISILEQAKDTLNQLGYGLAGIIVEPIQGRGGLNKVNNQWLGSLKDFCSTEGTMLIFDEVWTGCGRSGKGLLYSEVQADLVCIGKGLGFGMPLSACMATDSAFSHWPQCYEESLHTGTFFGHPLACSVSLTGLQYCLDNNIWDAVESKGIQIRNLLLDGLAYHAKVTNVRQYGLLLGIEFKENGMAVDAFNKLRSQGLLALPSGKNANILTLSPALNISQDDITEAVLILVKCLNSL